jgi:hypothetical protein
LFEKVISLKVLWAPINKGDFTGIREKIEKKELPPQFVISNGSENLFFRSFREASKNAGIRRRD